MASFTWNNRIVKSRYSTDIEGKKIKYDTYQFSIREVYYSKKGKIQGWTQQPLLPIGESVKDLKGYVTQWQEAFKAPVLLEKGKKLIEIK